MVDTMEENSSSNSIAKEEHVSKETDDVPLKSVSRWYILI